MREEEEARTSCRCHPQRPHPPWPPSTVPPGGGQREPGHPGVAAAGPQPHALPSAHVPTLLVTPHPREAELWSPEQWDCPRSQEAEGAGVACPVRAPQGLWDAASASHTAAHPAPTPHASAAIWKELPRPQLRVLNWDVGDTVVSRREQAADPVAGPGSGAQNQMVPRNHHTGLGYRQSSWLIYHSQIASSSRVIR